MKKKSRNGKKSADRKGKAPEKIVPVDLLLHHTGEFFNDLDCAQEVFRVADPVLEQKDRERKQELDCFFKRAEQSRDRNDRKHLREEDVFKFISTIQKLYRGHRLFRNNTFIALVSRFDEYVGDVIRTLHKAYPDRLKNSERTLSYEEIASSTTLQHAVDRLINKEVDKVLRDSHLAQVRYLENQLGIQIKDGVGNWHDFVEITERRNILVHCGGTISAQYLRVCKSQGCQLEPKLKEGAILSVTPEYFERAHKVLYELAFKISQTIARKLFPDSLKKIDVMLNQQGVELLNQERWLLALLIFDYATNLPLKATSDDQTRKIFLINKCIALKFSGKSSESCKILDDVDWSSANTAFQLAVEVLKNNFKVAEGIMAKMNGDDPISEIDFKTWPLFKEFRKTDYFQRAFKQIYKKDYDELGVAKELQQKLQQNSTGIAPIAVKSE